MERVRRAHVDTFKKPEEEKKINVSKILIMSVKAICIVKLAGLES